MTASPILRWHGGKWKLAPWIISHFPAHRVYVEPFGGAASVLLRKPRCYAEVYNDLDGEVVNLFRVARDHGAELARVLELTPFAREEFDLAYLPSPDPIEQARRTVVRSLAGFGSNITKPNADGTPMRTGFRANSNRSGTTPAHDFANYPDKLVAIIKRLRGVVIEHRDAREVMAAHDSPETLHYVDPPYAPETRDSGGDYRHELTLEQHRELGEFLHTLSGHVVLSGYRCPLYDEIFADWPRIDQASHADGARPRVESLWLSPHTPSRRLL